MAAMESLFGDSGAQVEYGIPQGIPDPTVMGGAADRLLTLPGAECQDAIGVLFKLVHNILASPEDLKKRKVKLSNPKIHEKVGRHAAALDFLRGVGFVDGQEGDEAVLEMPTAWVTRLMDAHHVLATAASRAGMAAPAMPMSAGFNPYQQKMQSVDTNRAKATQGWKTEAEQMREEVKRKEEQLRKPAEGPPVAMNPMAFWQAAGRRLEDVVREQAEEDMAGVQDGKAAENAILAQQVANFKSAMKDQDTFKSADKKRLVELKQAEKSKSYTRCVLRIICPDKSVLQASFRAQDGVGAVMEKLAPCLSPQVLATTWYLYQTPPLVKLDKNETMMKAGLCPGALVYLGFEGAKPAEPYLAPDFVRQLGAKPQGGSGVAGHSFSGEAMGWGAGQRLGGPAVSSSG